MIERKRTDLINNLVTYGLTPVQAQAYLTLLKLGNATAKSISRSSDINRVDIYRALRHLKKFGMIEEKLGNPTEFVAVDPEQALDILISSKLRVVDHLRTTKPELRRSLQDLKLESVVPSTDDETNGKEMFLKVVWGEQMFRRVKSVLSESKKEILTIFAPSVMVIYDQMGIPELSAEKHRTDDLRIRALTEIVSENLDQASLYSRAVELRHNDLVDSQLRYTIGDDDKLIIAVGDPPSNVTEGTALWTNSRVLISALKADFEAIWEDSIPAKERIGQLLTTRRWEKA